MNTVKSFVKAVNAFVEWTGKITSFIALALVGTITIDVFMRYVLNSPTKWSYDITYMLGGTLILFSVSYVLLHRGHVAIDLVRRHLPKRASLTIDIVLHLLLFFPLIGVLVYNGTEHAIASIAQRELSNVGFWRPPLYPFRTMIPIALALVLLQGIANFLVDLCSLTSKREDS